MASGWTIVAAGAVRAAAAAVAALSSVRSIVEICVIDVLLPPPPGVASPLLSPPGLAGSAPFAPAACASTALATTAIAACTSAGLMVIACTMGLLALPDMEKPSPTFETVASAAPIVTVPVTGSVVYGIQGEAADLLAPIGIKDRLPIRAEVGQNRELRRSVLAGDLGVEPPCRGCPWWRPGSTTFMSPVLATWPETKLMAPPTRVMSCELPAPPGL